MDASVEKPCTECQQEPCHLGFVMHLQDCPLVIREPGQHHVHTTIEPFTFGDD